ncbi:MAG: type II toxin-antitoxin system HipA family toxin YjjJ [Gammaproteobacteria bacterium]|nr:type II toxin-antitoxin system HipA family toxin YjjJ [Gammaproteobacteria bacterium]
MALSIRDILRRGPATSKALQIEADISQAGVSRQLRALGDSVVRLPGGRAPRYALARNAFGGDDRLPVYMVDADGNNAVVAYLRPLAHGGYFVEPLAGMPPVLLGETGHGVYDDLPYFLADMAPQGFLGKQIALEMALRSPDFPEDPRHWNTDHIGRYLVSNGDDLPGNLAFGAQAHLRIRREPQAVGVADFPALADAVMGGAVPGSSAGGEQPKFTAYSAESRAHMIVKFSPPGNDPVARRWRDILVTEHHALEAMRQCGVSVADARLLEVGDRLFLESQRFDRQGKYGRMPMLSLQCVDAEFTGIGSNWPRAMHALEQKGMVSSRYVYEAEMMWVFGKLINNTDMHLGNLSLGIDGSMFRLLPVYDMCSMGFAPRGGEVLPYEFVAPEALPVTSLDDKAVAGIRSVARTFWHNLMLDERISPEFREFLQRGNPAN